MPCGLEHRTAFVKPVFSVVCSTPIEMQATADDIALCPLKKMKYEICRLKEIKGVAFIKFSPCTSRLGLVLSDKKSLRILEVDYSMMNYQEIFTYHCDFEIEEITWSPDSCALLLVSLKYCLFTVVNCLDSELTFRVQDPNTVHLASVCWVPDSKHLLSISSFNIFTFAHAFENGKRISLPSICCNDDSNPLLAFSNDGKYAGSITFHSSSYHVSLLSTATWNELWSARCPLHMIQGLEWSSDSSILAVWNSCKQISFFGLDGECMKELFYDNFECSGFLLGIFSLSNDLFLVTCSQNEVYMVLVYNIITWQLCAVLRNEIPQQSELVCTSSFTRKGLSSLRNPNFPVKSPLIFSHCGNLLASSPKKGLIMIWNLREGFEPCKMLDTKTSLAGLLWHPKKTHLAALTSDGTVLVWKHSQGGPIDKKDKFKRIDTCSTIPSTMLWSQKNLILSPLRGMQNLVVLVNKRRSNKNV